MKLHTTIEIPKPKQKIRLSDSLLFVGSCFAENIGEKFNVSKFQALVNPFGVLYNPLSVAEMLKHGLGMSALEVESVVQHNNLWHSFAHHGSFSNESKAALLASVKEATIRLSDKIKTCDYIFITWGTAWVYRYLKTGKVVSNCHKIPSAQFERFRLGIQAIEEEYTELISSILEVNPNVKIILSVSPVRHLKDTAHGNQLSKSVLLLAAEQLMRKFELLTYFPSYEIILDELRDYRFYADDLVHPNSLAVAYIWEKLKYNWMEPATVKELDEIQKVIQAAQHRPFNPHTEAHQNFVAKTLNKMDQLQRQIPTLNFEKEREMLNAQIQ